MGSSFDPIGTDGSFVAAFFLIWMLVCFGSMILGVVSYVLHALGLYTIGQRRQIKHAWMAWLPVVNLWILGSISDQYQYVVKGKVRNRRKTMVGLSIAMWAMYIVFWIGYIMLFVNMFMNMGTLDDMGFEQGMQMLGTPMLISAGAVLVMLVLAIVLTVFQYMAYYDLYASCKPDSAGLFTVLSILINVTLPFFVFGCRKSDRGMPPKKSDVQPQQIEAPVEAPVVAATEEKPEEEAPAEEAPTEEEAPASEE